MLALPIAVRRGRAGALVVVAACAPLGAAGVSAAAAHPPTTIERALTAAPSAGSYARLVYGPGSPRVVREELGARAAPGRETRRRSRLYLAQMTDFQLADEESPARTELLDLANTPFTAAWRPQEAFGPATIDASIRQVNRFQRSPVRDGRGDHAAMDAVIVTGDNADNQQRNEVRWSVRLLEGGRLDPNSGVARPLCGPRGEGGRYTGVQDDRDVLESGRFYDPNRPSGDYAAFPRWPGLMDRAQRPFEAAGLRVPSYVAFGNHDGLVQGNVWANYVFAGLAVSCLKPLSSVGLTSTTLTSAFERSIVVPPDPDRALIGRREYMALHRTGRQADAHGFGLVDPAETKASNGSASYYAFSPRPGIRLISLNTVAEGSLLGSDGNLDDPQFRWLERQLDAAARANQLVVVYGHHPIRTLVQRDIDEQALPCLLGPLAGPGCDADPRPSSPVRLADDVRSLLLAHRNVIAYVAGHTHAHHVQPYARADGSGFWSIETASHADWPINSRLLELMDNEDGTLSIFATAIDNGARPETPAPGRDAAAFSEAQLASIGQELAFNDPQAGGRGASAAATGTPRDRNVELLVRDPRRR